MLVMKKPLELHFEFADKDQVIQTREGPVTARTGDAIMTGTQSEQWPIRRDKFEKIYDFDEASGTCVKNPVVVEAQKMDEPFQVTVGWSNEPLQGKPGDYLLTYGPNDFGVVDAQIFAETYDMVQEQPQLPESEPEQAPEPEFEM